MFSKLKISILIGISAPIILRYLVKKRYKQLVIDLKNLPKETTYYECMFFDYKNFQCKPHFVNKQECGNICSYTRLKRLLRYIDTAKKSISICMYVMTLKQINDQLISAAKRGVLVRLIIDRVNSKNPHVKLNLDHLSANGTWQNLAIEGDWFTENFQGWSAWPRLRKTN